jgi:hypothetical protein
MIRTILCAALIAAMPAFVQAEEPLAEWQEKALEEVKAYNRVRNAQWQSPTLLWLFAPKADIAWDTIADQVTCNHLRSAGMPEGSRVMVAFYDYHAAIRGEADRMGYALCR